MSNGSLRREDQICNFRENFGTQLGKFSFRKACHAEPMNFAQTLKQRRNELQLSQSQLGQVLGIDRKRISDYESGRRIPDDETVLVIAKKLGFPDFNVDRQILKASTLHLARPRSYSFDMKYTTESRIYRAMERKPILRRLTQYLSPVLMRQLNQLPCDSCWEGAIVGELMGLGAKPTTAIPLEERFFQHGILHPIDKLPAGHLRLPALQLLWNGNLLLFIPQVLIEKPKYTLDFLVGLRRRDKPFWLDLEADGEDHDFSGDKVRTNLLSMPTLRYQPDDICSPTFGEDLMKAILKEADNFDRLLKKAA